VQSRFVRAQLQPFLLGRSYPRGDLIEPTAAYNDASWFAYQRHAKVKLRVAAWQSLRSQRGFARVWRRSAAALFKSDEYAKPGKYPRQIINVQTENALQGGHATEFLKTLLSAPMVGSDYHFQFIKKPNRSVLTDVFLKLIHPTVTTFFYFSDDSCFAHVHGSVVRRFNVDISACDRSHGPELFNTLLVVFPEHRDILSALIQQCQLPIVYVDPVSKERLAIIPNTPRLYTGCVLTTIMANLASLCIGLALKAVLDRNPYATQGQIITGVERTCGYTITLQECVIPEDLQFLKHSPCRTLAGEYRPLLNPGVVLRLTGTCRGDLPGVGPIAVRARHFQKSLLDGLYVESRFPWFEALREKLRRECASDRSPVNYCTCHMHQSVTGDIRPCRVHGSSQWQFTPTGDAPDEFSDLEAFRRYGFDEVQIQGLYVLVSAGFGQSVSGSCFSRILDVDYGLSTSGFRYEPHY
jgi:hypothetical protein